MHGHSTEAEAAGGGGVVDPRRAGEHPPVRCDHLQPGRSLALRGVVGGLLDRSAGRIAMQSIVERGSFPFSAETRADWPDFRAGGPVRQYSRSVSLAGEHANARELHAAAGAASG